MNTLNRRFEVVKKILPVLALLVAFLWLTGCQPNGPKIEITPAEKDLGKVPQKVLETTYTIRNSGNSPLKISKVYTSCDCTKASVDSSEIQAGETTTLHVLMDPALLDLYGNIRRDIFIDTNDPKTPQAKAVFRVNIEKP